MTTASHVTTSKRIQCYASYAVGLFIPITVIMLVLARDVIGAICLVGLLLALVGLLHMLTRPDAPTPRPSWQDFRNAFLSHLPELVDDPLFAGRLADIAVHARPEPAGAAHAVRNGKDPR